MPTRAQTSRISDRTLVLTSAAVLFLLILLIAFFGPSQGDDDPAPTTYNAGTRGIKAAFLLAPELGYTAQRWLSPATNLARLDAASTTLILTDPILPIKNLKPTQDAIASFLARGGRVLATGPSGAQLLPGGATAPSTQLYKSLCYTLPEGAGLLARAGSVTLADPARWSASGPQFHTEQRCGDDAVVVRFAYGLGTALWWSSPMPLTNLGLHQNPNLALVLATLGPAALGPAPPGPAAAHRTLLFDEYLHEPRESLADLVSGLPWGAFSLQLALLALLLVLSRGRRTGPLRLPVRLPRTSPLEFAHSMGRLYARAHATSAATEAARARLLRFLAEHCGLSRETLAHADSDPEAIPAALTSRLGGDWTSLGLHLQQAAAAATTETTTASALRLVRALEADRRALEQRIAQTHAHT